MPVSRHSDGWRVMRFENASGQVAEVASNRVGPEAIPVPDGYRFVSATPMVPADADVIVEHQAMYRALRDIANGTLNAGDDPGTYADRILLNVKRRGGLKRGGRDAG